MNKMFYPKLAWTNLVKNRRIYLPYSLACMCSIAMFYILYSISTSDGVNETLGASYVREILFLGTIVIGIFSVVFLFYTNSFLMKRRKKEIGLYNILGMEKKHIAKMLFLETTFISVGCLVLGLLSGILFSRLVFLMLLKLIHFDVPFAFSISLDAAKWTVLLFVGIFILTLLTNWTHIHLAKPIELLKGGQVGEREPKTKWVLTIFGLVALALGYGIAWFVESPLMAIALFFVAAILVMFGTYALFTSGSIVLLKLLRKNRKFYYQINHFTSVSSMIYRMKQNAVGLSNICILSSAVLVMISTSVSLYVGTDDVINSRFLYDMTIQYNNASDENSLKVDQLISTYKDSGNIELNQELSYHYKSLSAIRDNKTFTTVDGTPYSSSDFCLMTLMTEEDYNRIEQKAVQLAADEVVIYSNNKAYGKEEIVLNTMPFRVKEEVKKVQFEKKTEVVLFNGYVIVVKDEAILQTIYEKAMNEKFEARDYFIGLNLKGNAADKVAIFNKIHKELKDQFGDSIFAESRELNRDSFHGLQGGLLFIGIFLGLLFLMATALIIYYKQISEGYDDQERYAIMQKVGMSRQEVKKTIKSQIILVFFLPLLTAVLHIAVAFKMIVRLLAVLNLFNVSLFFLCTVGTIVIFAIIYAGVYTLTAKAYYKIVQ